VRDDKFILYKNNNLNV
jgi:hypothetical protein